MNPMNSDREDRENTRNFLENTHIFVQLLFSFWGNGNVKMNVTKNPNLANLEILRFFGLIYVIYEIKF